MNRLLSHVAVLFLGMFLGAITMDRRNQSGSAVAIPSAGSHAPAVVVPTNPVSPVTASIPPVSNAALPVATSMANVHSVPPSVSIPGITAPATSTVPSRPSGATHSMVQQSDQEIKIGPWRFVKIPRVFGVVGSPDDEPGRSPDEKLQSVVITDSIYILTTETPQSLVEFAETGVTAGGIAVPAVNMSFDEAVDVCNALNRRFPGLRFRLPTEVEWEFSARFQCRTPLPIPAADSLSWQTAFTKSLAGDKDFLDRFAHRYAWFGGGAPQPCGLLLPNELGLYDMGGNVWEWCMGEKSSSPELRPICGGGWPSTSVWNCRSASRSWEPRSTRRNSIGFRIVIQTV